MKRTIILAAAALLPAVLSAPAGAQIPAPPSASPASSMAAVNQQLITVQNQYKQTLGQLDQTRAANKANMAQMSSLRAQVSQVDQQLAASRKGPQTTAAKQEQGKLVAQRASLSQQTTKNWAEHMSLIQQSKQLWAQHMTQIQQAEALYAQRKALQTKH